MTDLICFKVDKEYAERLLKALKKDFYGSNNPYSVGEPFFDVDGSSALFYCPLVVIMARRVVERLVFEGFKSSAKKKGIVLTRVKVKNFHKKRYEEFYEENVRDADE